MTHWCQRINLRTCLLSLFQWYSPQIYSTHCHLFTCHLFIWRDYMAYVSLFLPHQYVVGRTSYRRNYGDTLCFRFRKSRTATPGTFCGRNGRGRKYRRRNNSSRRRRNVINANSCHHIGTLVTSKWHDCDKDMSQLCQHDGTSDTIAFNLIRKSRPMQRLNQ